jgi:hypothetical protein
MKFIPDYKAAISRGCICLNKRTSGIFVSIITSGLFLLLYSCSGNSNPKKISQGEIEYHIDFLDSEKDKPVIMLLPKSMTTYFQDHSTRTTIEGLLGTFRLNYIMNYGEQQNYTMLQIMDKKYVYESSVNQPAFGYQNMDNLQIDFTDKQKTIAGYKCRHAIVTFPTNGTDTIELYYTNEIDLKSPNQSNPFKEIDGVLLEFSVKIMGIKMKMNAKRITQKKLKPDTFDLPAGYVKIEETEMEKILNDFNISSRN